MKILMLANVRNNRTGGVARILHYLSEALRRQGHRVDLLFSDDVPDPLSWLGLTGLTFPILLLLPVRRLIRARGPYDIVSIHSLVGAAYVWLRKRFRRLPKCVIVSYGSDELRWRVEEEDARLGLKPLRLKSRLLYYPLIILQARYATRNADHVITAARSEKEFYTKTYPMDPNSVSVVPHGVSEAFFGPRDYRRAPKRLLFLGGWEWRKGRRYLVEAFSRVAEKYPEVTLSLVGTGDSEADVKRLFPSSLHRKIRVISRVESEAVPEVYAQHDIFVFPSLFEGMPLVVPEAMASGMPVVTTQTCGMQDIVEDGITGFLVPPRDSTQLAERIRALLDDPQLCERLGTAARDRARGLLWDRIAHQTALIYENLLSKR